MKQIKVAIAGIGNCASALIQGIEYYRTGQVEPIGIAPTIGGYGVEDIKFVAGFEVNKHKVGRTLDTAIFSEPNCAEFLYKPGHTLGVVYKGPVFDGLDSNIAHHVPLDAYQEAVEVERVLRDVEADVLIILLPTGSQKAAEFYAAAAIRAGCAVVNGMPADIANNHEITAQAKIHKVPIIGDDIKSQIGATIVHRALTNLFPMQDALMERTIQLDWGGDMDFCNLTSNQRYEVGGKRRSKTESIVEGLPNKDSVDVQVSAVDYIPFLRNQKEAYIRVEGRIFGGKQVRIDVSLQVQDAYNSAGVLANALRVAMIGKDRQIGGVLMSASSMFNKRPPEQLPDVIARQRLNEFIQGTREV